MSLIVTAFVPGGIVMSADSRTTLVFPNQPIGTQPVSTPIPDVASLAKPFPIPEVHTPVVLSDSTYKVFAISGRFGISTCGAALIQGMPVAHHIEKLEQSFISAPATTHQLAEAILTYFKDLNPIQNVWFHVCGYDNDVPWVVFVDVNQNSAFRANINGPQLSYGARWNGDLDIASRISGPATSARFAFDGLNIQDAIDFTRHMIRTTIDQMRFELNFPTVGGPIDTLMVNAKGASFLERKVLHCT